MEQIPLEVTDWVEDFAKHNDDLRKSFNYKLVHAYDNFELTYSEFIEGQKIPLGVWLPDHLNVNYHLHHLAKSDISVFSMRAKELGSIYVHVVSPRFSKVHSLRVSSTGKKVWKEDPHVYAAQKLGEARIRALQMYPPEGERSQ